MSYFPIFVQQHLQQQQRQPSSSSSSTVATSTFKSGGGGGAVKPMPPLRITAKTPLLEDDRESCV